MGGVDYFVLRRGDKVSLSLSLSHTLSVNTNAHAVCRRAELLYCHAVI